MNKSTITVSRTAHICEMGAPGPHVRQIWIVCHGYAQMAADFLENFSIIDTQHTLVVAPEGMNYFYKKGFDGPVVANWMTRYERTQAIADNAKYLQAVYDHYLALLPADVRIVLLGFSQGTATICRWVMARQPRFHDMILWAGLPPEDLQYAEHREYFSDKNLYLLYGTNDPFLTPDRMRQVQEIEQKNGIDFGEKQFEGGHEIPTDVLRELFNKLS